MRFHNYLFQFICKQIIQVLLNNQADFNIIDKNHRTPLHYACQNGNVRAVKTILNYDAENEIQVKVNQGD